MYSRILFAIFFLSSFLCFLANGGDAQDVDDKQKHLVLDYILRASELRDRTAYRFRGQMVNSRDDNTPSTRIIEGFVAVSEKQKVEYCSTSLVSLDGGATLAGSMEQTLEYLRYKDLRFEKNYLGLNKREIDQLPNRDSRVMELATAGAKSVKLELDRDGNPMPRRTIRICPWGLPLSSPFFVMRNETDIDKVGDSFFTRFQFKESTITDDLNVTVWYAYNRSGLVTVFLDPTKGNVPVGYVSNPFDKEGNKMKDSEKRAKSNWVQIGDDFFPSKVVLSQNSKRMKDEMVFDFEFMPTVEWESLAANTDWAELQRKPGPSWQMFIRDEFEKRSKRTTAAGF